MTDSPVDRARYWRHPGLPDVELLKARFVRHAFSRHTHDTYAFALVETGVEEYSYRGALRRAFAGSVAVVEPNEVHTGQAGTPSGWRYRVLYPGIGAVTDAAADLGLPAPPAFPDDAFHAPEAARRLRAAHMAAERGDRLSASSLTREALVHIMRRHARPVRRARAQVAPAPSQAAADARDLLHGSLVDPPRLDDLAAAVGCTPFALLRAFRSAYGLPPHAYLNQVRVHRARRLLLDGVAPAQVAAAVGFADQSHLSRHFKRSTGVPPGAFQKGVAPIEPRGTASSR
ncbi:AraC family transcriptional regulator [Nocardiopsis sediminis]|uniref:AraC family transcriptional regulator n=1 Tax=Nocardiopsis sediminis TaxID=1778267 RepID=A0ABV8FR43_9ACTN